MSRSRRCVLPRYAHHVYQRGVRKDAIFHEDSDRLVYMRAVRKGCDEHGVRTRGYSLMTNHVHLVLVPEDEHGISKALHGAHTAYSNYFNAKYGFSGHLWEGRPGICAMDETYMWNGIRYVERNPVRAGIVLRAEDYLWSSAAAHCGIRRDLLLSEEDFPPPGIIENWSKWLETDHSADELRIIREHISTGRPWCTPEFLIQLEELTGRNLSIRKRGRPRSTTAGKGKQHLRLFF